MTFGIIYSCSDKLTLIKWLGKASTTEVGDISGRLPRGPRSLVTSLGIKGTLTGLKMICFFCVGIIGEPTLREYCTCFAIVSCAFKNHVFYCLPCLDHIQIPAVTLNITLPPLPQKRDIMESVFLNDLGHFHGLFKALVGNWYT